MLPSLLGGGGGAGSAAGAPKATRTWEFHLTWARTGASATYLDPGASGNKSSGSISPPGLAFWKP